MIFVSMMLLNLVDVSLKATKKNLMLLFIMLLMKENYMNKEFVRCTNAAAKEYTRT